MGLESTTLRSTVTCSTHWVIQAPLPYFKHVYNIRYFILSIYLFNIFIFLKIVFMRETERQRHRQREKQTPWGEPDVELDPRTLGSQPESKADTQPLSHPRTPTLLIEDTVYPYCLFLALSWINWPYMHGFISGLPILFHWSYVLVFMTILYNFNYYRFLIHIEIREHDAYSFVSLCQDCFGYLGSFVAPYKF